MEIKAGMLIATKARFPTGKGRNNRGLSRPLLTRTCEAGLRRLRVETIDLYQLHERDDETPPQETMEALDSLARSGEVRSVEGPRRHGGAAWLLGRPAESTLVIGARIEAQLEDHLAAAELELAQKERGRLDKGS